MAGTPSVQVTKLPHDNIPCSGIQEHTPPISQKQCSLSNNPRFSYLSSLLGQTDLKKAKEVCFYVLCSVK
ncbi:hypothetical protein CEXT_546811 [Caerostris extrusa]|uniref:Uncharacterized protein n=1 Tax=Caerostris extrusa TaxID=172846 RepID=A0AAV4Y8U1_CAEEX|nr:hypothetical protein CEXT_546811 [Caerostris extrusa]